MRGLVVAAVLFAALIVGVSGTGTAQIEAQCSGGASASAGTSSPPSATVTGPACTFTTPITP